jgi:hypothetical protein
MIGMPFSNGRPIDVYLPSLTENKVCLGDAADFSKQFVTMLKYCVIIEELHLKGYGYKRRRLTGN